MSTPSQENAMNAPLPASVLAPQQAPVVVNYTKGGIGNQLFQHVFAQSLARRLGASLQTDASYFAADPYGFAAAVWHLDPQAQSTRVADHAGPGSYVLREGQIQALAQLQQLPPDARSLVLEGYWQGEAYFERDVALQTYAQMAQKVATQLDGGLVERLKAAPHAVAVHVRRRDYGHMGLCRTSYYVAAIEHLRANHPDAELFVFSDEPNYTRHLMQSRGWAYTAVSSGSDLGDLYLMSLCRHFVISNSSYSWWGAWFGEHGQGARASVIIAPKEWVTIDATPSPCPARWVQLPDAVEPFAVDPAAVELQAKRVQRIRFDEAIRQWFGGRGDQTLRVEFPELGPDSVVLDLGGYKGDWTAEITQRYDARVMIFEPLLGFHQQICQRFAANPKVQPFQCGLGARDETLDMHHSADGSGAFVQGESEQVRILEATQFLQQHGIERIDLLKVNIEGGEYELLEHLIATGDIRKVRKLQVQFHDFVPDAIPRRARILQGLAQTHAQHWNFHFVWEEWGLKPELA